MPARKSGSLGGKPDYVLAEIAVRLISDGTDEGVALGKSIFERALLMEILRATLEEVLLDRGRFPTRQEQPGYRSLDDVQRFLSGLENILRKKMWTSISVRMERLIF